MTTGWSFSDLLLLLAVYLSATTWPDLYFQGVA